MFRLNGERPGVRATERPRGTGEGFAYFRNRLNKLCFCFSVNTKILNQQLVFHLLNSIVEG